MSQLILIGEKANDPNDNFFLFGVNTDEWYKKKLDERRQKKIKEWNETIDRRLEDNDSNDMKHFDYQHKFNCDEGDE